MIDLLDDFLGKGFTEKAIVFLKEYFKFLIRKWWIVLVLAIGGGGYGYWKVKDIKPVYSATTSFVLTTESGGPKLGGLASQFGLDLGGSSNDNVFSGDNIIELFKSSKILTKVLFHKLPEKKYETLINYIIEKRTPKEAAVVFFPDSSNNLSIQENVRLRGIIALVAKSFVVFKKDKKLSIYTISTSYEDEELAYLFDKIVVQETATYFAETKTQVSQRSLQVIQKQADSLYNLLSDLYGATGAATDRIYNLNPSLLSQRTPIQFQQAKLQALTTAYTEVMRNLQIAKITVQKEMPLFQIIDEPSYPLAVSKPNINSEIKNGGISGIVLSMIILLLLFLYFNYESFFRRKINTSGE